MNKRLTLFAALALTLGLTACTGGEDSTSSSSNPASEQPASSVVDSSEAPTTSSEPPATSSQASSEAPSSSSNEGPIETPDPIYVATNDKVKEGADGTKENPYNFLGGLTNLKKGGTLYMMEGTYEYTIPIIISSISYDLDAPTREEERKTIAPAPTDDGGKADVIIDFSDMGYGSSNRGISFNSNYWTFRDIEVMGAGDNGVYIGGHHNIIEGVETHHCRDTGIQLGRASSTFNDIEDWPSYNTILNCTSHDNADPTGEDSDGFACKLTTGIGNVFDGCIAYNNVDDGWDLYTKGDSGPIGPVTIRNCIAFNNGITTDGVGTPNSDGNGFKLGGETIAVAHQVYNSLAFNNLACGFTDNSNPGTIRIENCSSFNNGVRDFDSANFDMARDTATSSNYYKNLLSYCSGYRTSPTTGETVISNSKDEYCGTASYSVFYYGLAMYKFGAKEDCNYESSGKMGTLFTESNGKSPFISTETLQEQSKSGVAATTHANVHNLYRNADGSIKLGDRFKVDPTSDFYTMGENGKPLGCDLSGVQA